MHVERERARDRARTKESERESESERKRERESERPSERDAPHVNKLTPHIQKHVTRPDIRQRFVCDP